MALPLRPPVLPQLAKSQKSLPEGEGWVYEPKWDGFRSIAFVDGGTVHLQSRNGKPLTRYFPELAFPAGRYVLDGEIVLFDERGRQDFDALGQRIHPAKSRIDMLAETTPTRFIAFDLLAVDDEIAARAAPARAPRAPGAADRGARRPHAGLRGPGRRPAVAAGRRGRDRQAPGGALPARRARRHGQDQAPADDRRGRAGLAAGQGGGHASARSTSGSTTPDGRLRNVGHTSGFTAKQKRELPAFLAPYETGERYAGEPSRWNASHELSGVVLRPELVVEVTFDHTSNERIRHGAKILRWRDDKDPKECTMEQLDQ